MQSTLQVSEAHLRGREVAFLPVLVLYNLSLSDSPAYQTFCAAARHSGSDPGFIAVYDNSPVCQVSPEEQARLSAYHHDASNGRLAAAYNWALSLAAESGIEWLLLLDQDSELPPTFLRNMREALLSYMLQPEIAAVVPHVRGASRPISPCRVRFGRVTAVPAALSGLIPYQITAVNSGALVRNAFVRSIGGFNCNFPLDCLDHWLFHEIYAAGNAVAVVPVTLRHELSVHDYRQRVSAARYRSILMSEARFVARYKSWPERLLYPFRLLVRAGKQALLHRKPRIAAFTLGTISQVIRSASTRTGRSSI
jgi:hypothetical protein